MKSAKAQPETTKKLPSLPDKGKNMQEYLNHQVDHKTPAIIKAHHYLVVHYLQSLQKSNPPTITTSSSTQGQIHQLKSQNPYKAYKKNLENPSALSQSVVLQPSKGHKSVGEKRYPNLPSLYSLDMNKRENNKLEQFIPRFIQKELPPRKRQYQSLEIDQTQQIWKHKPNKQSLSNSSEDKSVEEYGETIKTARTRVQRKMLIRENSKSESQKRFKILKDRTLMNQSHDNEVLLLQAIDQKEEKEKNHIRHINLRARNLKKKMTIDALTSEQREAPCPWQSQFQKDYLMHQEMFDFQQY